VSLASWYMPYSGGVVQALEAWDDYAGGNGSAGVAIAKSTFGIAGSALFSGGPAASAIRATADLGDATTYNDAAATQQLARMWILGVPFGLQGRDLIRAVNMTQRGYSPLPTVLQAAGLKPVDPNVH